MSVLIILNLCHNYFRTPDKNKLVKAIDCLPGLIYMVRDLRLANPGLDSRRIESAGILLRKFDLGPEWIAAAIEDLTGNYPPSPPPIISTHLALPWANRGT